LSRSNVTRIPKRKKKRKERACKHGGTLPRCLVKGGGGKKGTKFGLGKNWKIVQDKNSGKL